MQLVYWQVETQLLLKSCLSALVRTQLCNKV